MKETDGIQLEIVEAKSLLKKDKNVNINDPKNKVNKFLKPLNNNFLAFELILFGIKAF